MFKTKLVTEKKMRGEGRLVGPSRGKEKPGYLACKGDRHQRGKESPCETSTSQTEDSQKKDRGVGSNCDGMWKQPDGKIIISVRPSGVVRRRKRWENLTDRRKFNVKSPRQGVEREQLKD